MARKSKILEEIKNMEGLNKKVKEIETLEPDAVFIQKINDSVMMIR